MASTLIREGYDVHVFEQAAQYKPFGGPIQIQSNALWALREINGVPEERVHTSSRVVSYKNNNNLDDDNGVALVEAGWKSCSGVERRSTGMF